MTESETLPERALQFATKAHDGQKRKYTGAPYISHPIEVAEIVSKVTDDPVTIAAAFMHDVVEDCEVTLDEVRFALGNELAELLRYVGDISIKADGNRKARKAIDRAHYAAGPPRAQTVKVADIISNVRSVVERDPDFAQVYLAEKDALLNVLTKADPTLLAKARDLVTDGAAKLAALGKPVKWDRG